MKTCVFYIDESGTPLPHTIPLITGQTPLFTLASIAFSVETWRERDRDYLRMKRYYFPDRMSQPGKRDEEIEIKGCEMTAPRNASNKRNHAFLRSVLKYIRKFNGKAFGVTFLKNHHHPVSSRSLYTQGLQILVERFNAFVEEHTEFTNGIIILDSRLSKIIGDRHDLEVARSHMSFIFGHDQGKTFDKIMEPPLFGDSRLSVGIQICDIFSSLLFTNHYHYHIHHLPGTLNYSHMQSFWSDINDIQFKSTNIENKYKIFGYRVINI